MIEKCYNLHDIVKFRVKSNRIPKRLLIEYENFEIENVDAPDFIIELNDFAPDNKDCFISDHRFYIKENYFYCEDSYKFGKWKIEVLNLESDLTYIRLKTNFVGRILADMFICAFVIDFFIRLKFERKGYSVVHAAAMSKENEAMLFPSQSGAGKTTTAMYLADCEYDYLGDDFVIIYKGKIFSYPTALNIFAYNLNPIIRENLSRFDNCILILKNAVYKLTLGKIKIFTKLNPKNIPYLNVVKDSTLKSVYLLDQGIQFSVDNSDNKIIYNSLIINQKMESYPFLKYFLEYSFIYPNSDIAHFWDDCRNNITNNIGPEIEFFRVGIPKKYTRDEFEKFKGVIECGN